MTQEKEMLVAEIVVGERHRKDMGDIQALAESIRAVGLLQPVGVDASKRLVFGERRLRAFRLLGWPKIPCRVVDVKRIADGEYAENEVRKDFTPSERVAIRQTMTAPPERRGRPKDKGDADNITGGRPEYPKGEETREVQARKAGFESDREFRRAEEVVENGVPKLVEMMDREEVSVSAAAEVADLPPEEQQEVVAAGPEAVKETAKKKREKPPAPSSKHPHSEMIVAWLKRVTDQTNAIHIEQGGIDALLAETDKWDWEKVDTYILPMLEAVGKTIARYQKDIGEAYARQQEKG